MALIAALSVEEARAKELPVDFIRLLPAHDWDRMEQTLGELRASAQDRKSQIDYQQAVLSFANSAIQRGPLALAELHLWQEERPDSSFPALLETVYWASWFAEYRGTGMSGEVTEAMSKCAALAQSAMLCALIRLAARDANAWVTINGVLHSVAALSEPKWWVEWLMKGTHPVSIPVKKMTGAAAELLARSGGDQLARLDDLPPHLPDIFTGEALAWRRTQTSDQGAALEYWLRLAFEMDDYALEVAAGYVCFLMPRWGGSIEAMLAFASSPLCARYSETDRNVLRYFAWFDELEVDGHLLEDERVVRNQLRIGEQMLKRPLEDNLRGRVHKYVAYLLLKLDRPDEARPHFEKSAPYNKYEAWEITNVITVWLASPDRGSWLGQIAEINRLLSPAGSALYGLLCANGWAGVEKRPDVANGWFVRAAEQTPDLTDVAESPFTRLNPLAELEGGQALLPMWLTAAKQGDASSQFRGGVCLQLEMDDHYGALELYRQAAYTNHPSATQNLIFMQLCDVDKKDLSPAEREDSLQEALHWLERARAFLPPLIEESSDDHPAEMWYRIIGQHAWVVRSSQFPAKMRASLSEPTLEFAQNGDVRAMIALGYWYSDRSLPTCNRLEAVRWCEAARQINPEQEFLDGLIGDLEGGGLLNSLRYSLQRRRVRREGLPGQFD